MAQQHCGSSSASFLFDRSPVVSFASSSSFSLPPPSPCDTDVDARAQIIISINK